MDFDNLWWLAPSFSSYSGPIDVMWNVITVIIMIAFFGVEIALVLFLLKYKGQPGRKAFYTHGSHKLEIVWTCAPTVILVALGLYSTGMWDEIKNTFPKDGEAYTIRIVAQQFNWNVYYPGPDGRLDTADDFSNSAGVVVVPENETVLIKLGSKDVIHSLFIPHMRVKQDAVPGTVMKVWFKPTRAGEVAPPGRLLDHRMAVLDKDFPYLPYEIACAELCGFGHYRMFGRLYVMPRAEVDRWLAAQ